jgi:hypothetical protein
MMLYLKLGLKRDESTMQFKLQKFVECSHFLMEHLFRGPPSSFNTDTGERGLKRWAKLPAKTAQNRGDDVFKQQVARNFHETYLLSQVLGKNPNTETQTSVREPGSVVVYGKNYKFVFREQTCGFFTCKDILKDSLCQEDEIMFPAAVKQWFIDRLSGWYQTRLQEEPNFTLEIPIYTEMTMQPPDNNNNMNDLLRLRAHPNYRGGGPWYDYATVRYEYENNEQGVFPVRCACFFQAPPLVPRRLWDVLASFDCAGGTVLVLVQECLYQTEAQKEHTSRLCSKWTLKSTHCTQTGRSLAKLSCIPQICLDSGVFAFASDLGATEDATDPFQKMAVNSPVTRGGRYDIVVVKDRREQWPESFLQT